VNGWPLNLETHRDDPVGAEDVGLGLHPGHREFAGVVHRLGERLEFLVLAPPAHLEADVVDARPEHEPERHEPGLAHQQELIDRQVRGEEGRARAGAHLGEPPHRVLGQPQCRGVNAHRCSLSTLYALIRTHPHR
jgi:hypothetical protein